MLKINLTADSSRFEGAIKQAGMLMFRLFADKVDYRNWLLAFIANFRPRAAGRGYALDTTELIVRYYQCGVAPWRAAELYAEKEWGNDGGTPQIN